MCWMWQNVMLFDSYQPPHRDQHNQLKDPTCVRHLEFGHVQFLHIFPNLRLVVHREKLETRLHWFAHR